ncbi:AraC family transcriptional regulator [Bradyrhizobium sp. SYSU BS000235]|uniref:AraC family transcriptional regulator n=1 Tax=Bradyrhizobium sp. SYSU BS000235 TaxID=3411332 RepID=UPI003C7828D2
MAPPTGKTAVLKFSTDDLPARDRITIWREVFARSVVKVDLEPLGEGPFRSESLVRVLPDVMVRSSSASAAVVRRTKPLVADGDDNLILSIIRKGQMFATQGNREVYLDNGGAYLWSNASTGVSRNPTAMDLVTISLTRRSLSAVVADLDSAVMRLVPASSDALRLLVSYVDILQKQTAPMTPDLLAVSATHIQDLAALALGATRDATEAAKVGGLRAARLQALKADIIANIGNPELSLDAIAVRHNISPRYIRTLFNDEQTSFSDFIREQRLRRAYRMLSNPQLIDRNVSAIALECGFGDLSHFNHSFRRRFGATPSDVRTRAQQERAT